MNKADLKADLAILRSRAFGLAEWAPEVLERYHALSADKAEELQVLHDWMLVPPTLWPFNIPEVLTGCCALLAKGKRLNRSQRLLLRMLPAPPSPAICAAVAEYEFHVQKGVYENLVTTQAKYQQYELSVRTSRELRQQWQELKAAVDVRKYQDHKGVIRRSMGAERNLRSSFHVDLRDQDEVFRAAFDAFCLRWNLYGMQHDEPLLLKLAVNLTPFGTLIHIPAYWSFDPKRDIHWDKIAKLHRKRVPGRQGERIAAGKAQRMHDAAKLRRLDREAQRRGLRGEKKHEFLCAGLGLDPRTSPKRFARLRTEFRS